MYMYIYIEADVPLVLGSKIVQTVSHEPGPADCKKRLLHLLFFDLFAFFATAIQNSVRSQSHSNP